MKNWCLDLLHTSFFYTWKLPVEDMFAYIRKPPVETFFRLRLETVGDFICLFLERVDSLTFYSSLAIFSHRIAESINIFKRSSSWDLTAGHDDITTGTVRTIIDDLPGGFDDIINGSVHHDIDRCDISAKEHAVADQVF